MSAATATRRVFFGLSGTGKTTLSADRSRTLIGDDEHGWSDDGIFNFEGGCYAKVIRLSPEAEPEIFATTQPLRHDPRKRRRSIPMTARSISTTARRPRTRAPPIRSTSYPNASRDAASAGHPKTIIMLTADAFGVMPPIARLTPEQAMYHFLSGYTAKVAGTERGVTEPQATFSACFGAPFIPRHPGVYGDTAARAHRQHRVKCWLVNTGWTGGAYGTGKRMPIKVTRALLSAALEGRLDQAPMRTDAISDSKCRARWRASMPEMFNPRETWADKRRL